MNNNGTCNSASSFLPKRSPNRGVPIAPDTGVDTFCVLSDGSRTCFGAEDVPESAQEKILQRLQISGFVKEHFEIDLEKRLLPSPVSFFGRANSVRDVTGPSSLRDIKF